MHSIFFALFFSTGFNVGCSFLSHDSGTEFKHIKGKADEGLLRYSVNFRGKKKELGQLVPDHGHINSERCYDEGHDAKRAPKQRDDVDCPLN